MPCVAFQLFTNPSSDMHHILLLFILYGAQNPSVTSRIDSLKARLRYLPPATDVANDSLRRATLKELMRAYSDKNIDSSFYFNTELVKHCERSHAHAELSYAFHYAGYLYQVRGDYHQSIRYHFKALTVAEKEGLFKQMARAHRGLAHAYSSLKEFEKAASHCQLGLKALEKEADVYTKLGILNVQGAIFREQKRLTDALKVNNSMYLLAKQKNEGWYESQGLHAIGWVYREMGDISKALDFYKQALVIADKIGSVDLQCSILLHISDAYFMTQKYRSAISYCREAKHRAEQSKNSSIVAESNEKLAGIYKSTRQFEKSLLAFEDFILLRDSLSKEKADHRIENLQALYDNVQKTNTLQKQQVQLLNEQNKGQRLAQDRNVLAVGIFSVLLAASLLYWNNRKLQAKNQQIETQRGLLENARQELFLMNQTLELRVDKRTEELSSANQELMRKNEEIKEALFKGQTIERKRVALELHDNLSSLLSAVNMSMQTINPNNLTELEQTVYRNVRQMLQSAYTEVRNISHNILPPELERDGLIATVNSLMSKMNQNSGLQLSMSVDQLDERLPTQIEFNLYSIIFELINNAIRHASATHLSVFLIRTNIGVELTVTDDGVGIHPESKRGRGLQNIHNRLESLGGTFDMLVPKEKGTWILIKIPIEL